MSPFDNHEYATEFLEPYSPQIAASIVEAFEDCRKMQQYHSGPDVLGEWADFHLTNKIQLIHFLVGARLTKEFRGNPNVRVLLEINNTELLFEERLRLRVSKVNDDLTFCTNNRTERELAYRNPSGRGLTFGFAQVAPIYVGYRMLPVGDLRDIYLIKYDNGEKQWHVDINGDNASGIQPINYGPIVPKPIISPDEEPFVKRRRA